MLETKLAKILNVPLCSVSKSKVTLVRSIATKKCIACPEFIARLELVELGNEDIASTKLAKKHARDTKKRENEAVRELKVEEQTKKKLERKKRKET